MCTFQALKRYNMGSRHLYLYFLTSFICFGLLEAFSFPFGGYLSSIYSTIHETVIDSTCKWIECCDKKWSITHFEDLERDLYSKVYGQQIVNEIIVAALKGHLQKSSPKSKALTLSFHGKPGVGKNYVASIIQKKLFQADGDKSKYTHFFSGRLHFPKEEHADLYKINLMDWIRGNVTSCRYSLFVFDEVDKMPRRVLDAIKPFIDYHERVDGIDFRKTTFIFVSNTGGDLIAQEYLKLWESGKKREKLQLRDFEDLIRVGAFNEKGGFYKSETIESNLIDHYLPFLPLEESHVKMCITDEFKKRNRNPSPEMIEEVLADITFGPKENPLFSNGGCKRIDQKTATVIESRRFKQWHQEL